MKSHVSLEQKVCAVTGKTYDTDAVLLDRRLEDSMEKHTVTGWGMCPEAQEQIDKGYIALVGIDEAKSDKPLTPESVYRTGEIAYIKIEAAKNIFQDVDLDRPFVFTDSEVIRYLEGERAKVE